MLVKRTSVQAGNECLDGEEGGQDTSEHSNKSKNDRDARCHTGRPVKVPLQRRTGIADVVVSKLLDPESTVSSPPN